MAATDPTNPSAVDATAAGGAPRYAGPSADPGYTPCDGDIVVDRLHPGATGMVCGGVRERGGQRGVYVEWDIGEWATDFEPEPFTRLGPVISSEASRHEEANRLKEAEQANYQQRVDALNAIKAEVAPTLAEIARTTRLPGSMVYPYVPVDGITVRDEGRSKQLIVAGYIVGDAQSNGGSGSCGDCRLCGDLRLFATSSRDQALNGVQQHLVAIHSDPEGGFWLPGTAPEKIAEHAVDNATNGLQEAMHARGATAATAVDVPSAQEAVVDGNTAAGPINTAGL
ncbi:hypothetical protein ACWDUL_20595 [Nocardia niigatensis]